MNVLAEGSPSLRLLFELRATDAHTLPNAGEEGLLEQFLECPVEALVLERRAECLGDECGEKSISTVIFCVELDRGDDLGFLLDILEVGLMDESDSNATLPFASRVGDEDDNIWELHDEPPSFVVGDCPIAPRSA